MYMKISEVKKVFPGVKSMERYGSSKKKKPNVIFRDYEEPLTPPFKQRGVKVFNFKKNPRPASDVRKAYGEKPNVSGIEVINAIKNALGTGDYELHIADGSYAGYSIWELQEYIENFDNTNLRPYVAATFDCDDFSQVLQGNVNGFFPGIAFGTIWYGPRRAPFNWGHSVNIFYSYTDKKIYLVEPQSNAFYQFSKFKWKAWMVIL